MYISAFALLSGGIDRGKEQRQDIPFKDQP